MFNDLKARFLIGTAVSLILFCLIFFSGHYVWVHDLVQFVMALIAVGALLEYGALIKAKGIDFNKWVNGALFLLLFFAGEKIPVYFALIVLLFSEFRNVKGSIERVGAAFLGLFYILIPFISIRQIFSISQIGHLWLLYLIIVTKMVDIGGYFIGKRFGMHWIAPQLSPKKSIEGAFGGLVFALIASYVFSLFGHISLSYAFLLPLVIVPFAILGDLAESLFKRDADVKDSSHVPGLGGLLDQIDSLLFTAPVLFFLLRFIL